MGSYRCTVYTYKTVQFRHTLKCALLTEKNQFNASYFFLNKTGEQQIGIAIHWIEYACLP